MLQRHHDSVTEQNMQTSKLQTFHTKCTSLQIYLRICECLCLVQPHRAPQKKTDPTSHISPKKCAWIRFLSFFSWRKRFSAPFLASRAPAHGKVVLFRELGSCTSRVPGVHLLVVVFVPPKGIGLQCTSLWGVWIRLDVVFGHPRMACNIKYGQANVKSWWPTNLWEIQEGSIPTKAALMS